MKITPAQQYLTEVKNRKKNLEVKQQIQQAVNEKELTMLLCWEESLERIISEQEKEKNNE